MADSKKSEGAEQNAGWKFHAEETAPVGANATAAQSVKPVQWTASEFIEHDKSAGWFLALAIATAGIAAIVYFLTEDVISASMIVIAAIAFGVFAARKPRVLEYSVDERGIKVAEKFYPYSSFKAFAVVDEGAVGSVWLMPLKRFMPSLTIYFAPDDGQKIVSVVSNYLPVQQHQPDIVDKFMQRIRF